MALIITQSIHGQLSPTFSGYFKESLSLKRVLDREKYFEKLKMET